ncbi:MAG: hypothetical protein M3154_03660, partial [Candidatus Eremiobacteraeota bacterium]|nr:hypothetical protein [Candidatus Eremiobacteraeota bacterium]
VTMYQAKIMRERQKASAWPYVMLAHSNAHGSELVVQNVGLGPALVRTVEFTMDGRAVRTWEELWRAVAQGDTVLPPEVVTSDVGAGTVLLPGNMVETFRIDAPKSVAGRLDQVARHDRLVRRLCYCSLYDDCWVADSHAEAPVAVRACVVDTSRAFRN